MKFSVRVLGIMRDLGKGMKQRFLTVPVCDGTKVKVLVPSGTAFVFVAGGGRGHFSALLTQEWGGHAVGARVLVIWEGENVRILQGS